MIRTMDTIFELFDYLHKHKNLSFFVNLILYCSIFFVSGAQALSWQGFMIFILLVIITTKNYIDGRQDEEAFNKKWRDQEHYDWLPDRA